MGKEVACTSKSSLNLVTDEQNVVLFAQVTDLSQVAFRRHNDTSFSLYRLHEIGADVLVFFELFLQFFNVTVFNKVEALRVGSELITYQIVSRRTDGCRAAAPEVVFRKQDGRLVFGNLLVTVAVASSKLDCGIADFRSGAHSNHSVKAEKLG